MRAYIDIETTGLDPANCEITVIGIYLEPDGPGRLVQLYEATLTREHLLGALAGTRTLYSYNGKEFDLPFIAARLDLNLARQFHHRDLMYDCWKQNLYGGQKRVELTLGIGRETAGMGGAQAAALWDEYRTNRDRAALKTLLRYNAEDVINLAQIRYKLGVS